MPSDADTYREVLAALGPRSDAQRALWQQLGRGHERRISTLCALLLDPVPTNTRAQQQRVGSTLTKLNRKLAPFKLRIMPGRARRTYRLYSIT